MKAILVDSEKRLVPAQVPDPRQEAGKVVIAAKAAGVNRADLLQVAGKYPPPPGWPTWPGLECAGIVADAPSDSRWKQGDRVCALLGGGGYAEYASVPEGMVLPMPENLTFAEAAALPEVYTTAYLNLGLIGQLKPGETLFVQAGASGLGIAAIQLAKHAFKATVVTTVGSTQKAEAVKKLGADVVINRKAENTAARLLEHPLDVALDCAGGEALADCLRAMRPGGRWILVATLGGETATIPLRVVLKQHLSLIGSTLRSRSDQEKSQMLRRLETDVWPLIARGDFKPLVHKAVPFDNAQTAHDILAAQTNVGKVVLTL